MRAYQARFDFDIFDLNGFTSAKVEDFEARQRKEQQYERERAARAEREWQARQKREQDEREARERREQYERSQRARAHSTVFDPWLTLGVRPGVSLREIRLAWVSLCKAHHPDAGGDAETMKRINAAYNTLKGRAR